MHPSFSPNGDRLAFTRFQRNLNLYRVAAKPNQVGAPSVFLSSTRDDFFPEYSPDGARIAFQSLRAGPYGIWVADAGGSNPALLFGARDGSRAVRSAWSPDGTRIVFDWDAGGQWEIYDMPVTGGSPRRLTDHPGTDSQPRFSGDGRWVYFVSNRTGVQEVWKIAADQPGSPVQVTHGGGVLPRESPDGKWVYVIRQARARRGPSLWRIAVSGATAEEVLPFLYENVFAIGQSGLFYWLAPGADGLCALQFKKFDGQPVTITRVRPGGQTLALTVSPDGRWVLFAHDDNEGSDLMMIENFR